MEPTLALRAALFLRLLTAWNDGEPEAVRELITPGYQGHMLHLPQGERSGAGYPQWIRDYRLANPGARFQVVDQATSGDRLWTRLDATLPGGAVSHGVNISRFEADLIAEEWAVWSGWL